MAVIEIINSLEDLDDPATSKVDSVPAINLMVKNKQEVCTRKTKVLRKKQSDNQAISQSDLIKQGMGLRMSKPGLVGLSWPTDGKGTQFPSLPFGPISIQEKLRHQHGPGFKLFPLQHVEDSELDFFHLPQFREERLEGCRRLANREMDEDSDDITYEYDDNDDSNLDDIVNALSRTSSTNEGEEDRSGGDNQEWEFVGNDWDDDHRLEFRDDLDLEAEYSSLDEKRHLKSVEEKKKYVDDNDILEEIFFVRP